ncbi:hypothetical protein [Rufibacter tibetensis]|nr:hypothetical protein [Rufibacter tibetensis]
MKSEKSFKSDFQKRAVNTFLTFCFTREHKTGTALLLLQAFGSKNQRVEG